MKGYRWLVALSIAVKVNELLQEVRVQPTDLNARTRPVSVVDRVVAFENELRGGPR